MIHRYEKQYWLSPEQAVQHLQYINFRYKTFDKSDLMVAPTMKRELIESELGKMLFGHLPVVIVRGL